MLRLPDCRWSSSQASWQTCSVRLRTRRASAAPWRPQSAAASRCGHLSQCKDWHQLGTPQLTLTPHQQPQGHTAQREAGGLLLLPSASRLPYGVYLCRLGSTWRPQTTATNRWGSLLVSMLVCPFWCRQPVCKAELNHDEQHHGGHQGRSQMQLGCPSHS